MYGEFSLTQDETEVIIKKKSKNRERGVMTILAILIPYLCSALKSF